MKMSVAAIPLILLVRSADAREVQLFDPGVFGHRTGDTIQLLFDRKGDELEPYLVQVDIRCGRYRAATVTYPQTVTFAEVKASLNALYRDSESRRGGSKNLALWRMEEQRFAVQLSVQDGAPRVVYIAFLPLREHGLSMTRALGGDRRAIGRLLDAECAGSAAERK